MEFLVPRHLVKIETVLFGKNQVLSTCLGGCIHVRDEIYSEFLEKLYDDGVLVTCPTCRQTIIVQETSA